MTLLSTAAKNTLEIFSYIKLDLCLRARNWEHGTQDRAFWSRVVEKLPLPRPRQSWPIRRPFQNEWGEQEILRMRPQVKSVLVFICLFLLFIYHNSLLTWIVKLWNDMISVFHSSVFYSPATLFLSIGRLPCVEGWLFTYNGRSNMKKPPRGR